ncbi:MAG: O-antigen ligase family protein [Nitrospira sp.]|nr:O-antigen ligase family protein [Nitrospira sp.]
MSSVVGYFFITVALLQPKVTFGKLPRPLWYFAAYLFVFVSLGIWQKLGDSSGLVGRLSTTIQMVVLFWISYNLFRHERVIRGTFLALSAGCVVLSVLQVGGSAANAVAGGRVSALSQDANSLGSMLGIGLLSLMGLAYGRASQEGDIGWQAWIGFAILAAGIVLSGSRGAFVALVAGIMCLAARPVHKALQVKIWIATVFALLVLVVAAYQNDAVRVRWERTFSEGHMSGRENIMPEAWNMFIQAPIMGWGPGNHIIELGSRFGRKPLDTHNGYLWVLTETGLLGAIPYFFALWLCLDSAWRARHGPEGSLPLALLVCVLLVNMSLTWHSRKILWMVLAYSVASETLLSRRWSFAGPPNATDKVSEPQGYGRYRS